MKAKQLYVIFVLIPMLLAGCTSGQHQSQDLILELPKIDPSTNHPTNISKLSYGEARDVISFELDAKINNVSTEYISNLVSQIRYGSLGKEKKILLIFLLGQLHPSDTNSIEVLIENIDLMAEKTDTYSMPMWAEGDYPAEGALMTIEKPSIPHVLEHLRTENNELRRHLMCGVLVVLNSHNGQVFNEADGKTTAQNQVKQMIAEESDQAKKANLELALKELEK